MFIISLMVMVIDTGIAFNLDQLQVHNGLL